MAIESYSPDTRSKQIGWLLRNETFRLIIGTIGYCLSGASWMFVPWGLSKIIDEALPSGSTTALFGWVGFILLAGIAYAVVFIFAFQLIFKAEIRHRYRIATGLGRHLSAVGTNVNGRTTSGDMTNLATDDTFHVASSSMHLGFFVMNIAAFGLGSVMVWWIDPVLGVVTLLGSILTGVIAGPVLNKLHAKQDQYRDATADLTTQASDIAGGLRILRGLGGERQFYDHYRGHSQRVLDAGYHVARHDSWVKTFGEILPLGLVVTIIWLGANRAAAGDITVGQLVAVTGYTTVLVMYSRNLIGNFHAFVTTWVAAGKLARFFSIPAQRHPGTVSTSGGDLYDPDSGVTVPAGGLTVIVANHRPSARGVARRLTGFDSSAARWGDTRISEVDEEELRRRVNLLDDDYLFPTTLQHTLDVPAADVDTALWQAAAGDVGNSLGGPDGLVQNGGRNLSGGQRQRLNLARALADDSDVLIAVEPTSAVDAATEAVIAERVADLRSGRTTVVLTASRLWTGLADHVIDLDDNGDDHADDK
ncbi:ABC transporter transmembrane domain-containing protein [Haloglycomyces albus]|uniref:ABC transporter transmembrane domain-containing protein n=1 Tax=Haloglycomyces albus TaxID=526067 RepID=UPI00046D4D23|nr:ABC transporter ATP-binding protein [Haloglycomyces albus]